MPERGRKPNASERELAIFAHEVRGALTIISGYAQVMRRPLSEDEKDHALDGIAHAARRIDRLVQSALDGRLSDGTPDRPVDLATLAEQVAEEQSAVTDRRVEAHVESRSVVLGAPEALERALGNLVNNALKYSLLDSAVEVWLREHDGWAELSVADRGPGIPEDERGRVFEPFERLEAHREVEGSGLGLAIVRRVAENHGGTVRIDDRPGGGAVVTLVLPLAPGTAA